MFNSATYETISSKLRQSVLFLACRANIQFCRFDKADATTDFNDTAITGPYSNTTFSTEDHTGYPGLLDKKKNCSDMPPLGVELIQQTPYLIGLALHSMCVYQLVGFLYVSQVRYYIDTLMTDIFHKGIKYQ